MLPPDSPNRRGLPHLLTEPTIRLHHPPLQRLLKTWASSRGDSTSLLS